MKMKMKIKIKPKKAEKQATNKEILEEGIERQEEEVKEMREKQQQDYMMSRGEDQAESKTIRHQKDKVGRNDPCPCGSGKKYKKCCGQ